MRAKPEGNGTLESEPGENKRWPSVVDGSVVARARAGDLDAFTQLLKDNDRVMRSVGWRILGNRDALEDALQDAYIKAFSRLGDLRSNEGFRSWLYRTVETTCLDIVRRESRRRHENVESLHGVQSLNDDPAELVVDRERLHEILDRLRPEHREVLVLSIAVGMSHQEIATYLNVAVGTVGSRLNRAHIAVEGLQQEAL